MFGRKKQIYLDYASSTPMCEEAILTYQRASKKMLGNASSVHKFGRDLAKSVDRVRESLARYINAIYQEIFFTSGATESNNLAILGLMAKFQEKRPGLRFHVITSKIEHPSVLETFKYLEKNNLAEVSWVDVGHDGIVNLDQLKTLIKHNTILISVMYVNNETGAIQPIRKIGKIVAKENERREKEIWVQRSQGNKNEVFNAFEKIYFHTDASQAFAYLNCDSKNLFVDMMTFSSQKIYGPQGIGAIFIKTGTPVNSIFHGGDQEMSLRPGSLNVPGILSFGSALHEIHKAKDKNNFKVAQLKNYLKDQLSKLPNIILNTGEDSAPHILNFSVIGKSGERLVIQLDQEGVAVSSGSACSAGVVESSHVLSAMHLDETRIEGAVRVSFGIKTTIKELDFFVFVLKKLIEK